MSSVPAVLAALTALGASTLPNSQAINGGVGTIPTTRDRLLLIGDDEILVDRQFDSIAGSGAVTMSEVYDVPCTTAADFSGGDQTLADAAVWADLEAFIAAILADPTLGIMSDGVDMVNVQPIGEQRFLRLPDENGKHAAVRFRLHVYAQVS